MVMMIEEDKQMTQEKKHSELPFKLYYDGGLYSNGFEESGADAKFIARSCNNFYPLLEACKRGAEVLYLEGTHYVFTKEERKEIAEYMIELWKEWAK